MSSFSLLGSNLLALALPAALYSFLMGLIAQKKKNGVLALSAYRATWLAFILICGAVVTLVCAFLTNDFSIKYVYGYSSRSLPLFYKLAGLWAGLNGSVLFWSWLVSLYSVLVLKQNRRRNPDWMPTINAVMMGIVVFFVILMLFACNPFEPLGQTPSDGRGLNPLLQNLAMVVHPPCLYLGFTGFSVPFAFAIAALRSRRLDSAWIEDSRRWTIIPWGFLSIGLILGGAWAYVELGWGGFWAWDPVENAALIPWLTATAYLHSVIVQKKRGMLMVWNATLVCLTFLFTIFGTYLTRSGIVQSVHAFSDSNLGPYFIFFMSFTVFISIYFIVSRLKELKSQNVLLSYLSRESAFLLNNVILLVSAFAIIWGTLFPTITEFFTGQRVTVGIPFFNQIMAPVGLVLLVLMGFGPMVPWRRANIKNLVNNLLFPALFGLVLGLVSFVFGLTQWYALGSVILISFVLGTLILEFYRGMRAIRIQKKIPLLDCFIDLLFTSNRRWGGYIVHLGVLLVFIGIAGTVFKTEADFSLTPGQIYKEGGYSFTYLKPDIAEDEHKTSVAAVVEVKRGEKKLGVLKPAKNFYRTSEQPSTEAAIYHTPLQDLYLIIGTLAPMTGKAEFRLMLNPLISFVWLGGVVILLGTIIILLPRGLRAAKKDGVPMAMILFFAASLAFSSLAHANEEPPRPEAHVENDSEEDPFIVLGNGPEKERLTSISHKLICQCGGCVRMALSDCTCSFSKKERWRLLAQMRASKSDSQIIDQFIDEYGLPVLAEPPHLGFFKSGTWVPWVVLFLAIPFALWIIFKLARRKNFQTKEVQSTPNDLYSQKLKDELRALE